jgi:Fe(3+) dicitrate transport protein
MYNSGVELRGEVPFYLGTCHLLHGGLRLHREEIFGTRTVEDPIDGGPRTLVGDAHSINRVFSANLDDTVKLGKFTVTGGARFEWVYDSEHENEVTGDERDFEMEEVFPGISVTYEPSAAWAIFANAHRSFRPPQTFSVNFTEPDQDLDFERGTNLEVGARYRRPGLETSATLWQVDFDDFIEFDAEESFVTNHGGFRSRGIDLTVDVDVGRFVRPLRGVSAYATATIQESELLEEPNKGKDTQYVPPLILSGAVRYDHPCGLYGVLDGAFRDDMEVTADNTIDTPGYALFGARLGWVKTWNLGRARVELDAAFAVKNLLDRDVYLRHANLSSNDATFYVPGPPREVFFDLAIAIEL